MAECGFRGNKPQINADEHRWSPVIGFLDTSSYAPLPAMDFGAAHRKGRKERKGQQQCGTQITRIGRIFTDQCASVQSVFHHVCSSLKNPEFETELSEFIRVNPWFFHDVDFQNYDALRHESTSINYILPLGGVLL